MIHVIKNLCEQVNLNAMPLKCIIIIIIIERKDLGGVMSKDCKDTLQTLKTCLQYYR